MKVKLKTRYCSPTKQADPGSVIDVSKTEADQLIEHGCATKVAEAFKKK